MKELSFEEQKELIEIEKKSKLEVLAYMRKTEELKHEWELQRSRIRTAEIRKSQMRKGEGGFNY
ncbi:MAG TPA: hypothetical protein VGA29_02580 [Ignavibacteriaceae bacterium]